MTQAIFLSYASQDADAARRICDALRAAGLEVWFDQSELRGGDAWDAAIRKQIKECSLFLPIISANTQARDEGYFRLEWKLAVDRSHLMADDKTFFFPIVIDDTSEAAAKVPDRFRERQWTRLTSDQATESFAAQIAKVVDGSASSGTNAPGAAPALASSLGIVATAAIKADDTPSIAVLAFANRSASADDEYFSDGLADELLNVLAKIKGLRVAARTSAFSFKGKQTTVEEIARVLNVAAVLEGSVRKSGNRVRISVQLIKAKDGFQMWGETYDRTLDDIFAVQDDIAQSVVKELRTALLGGESTVNPVAIEQEIATAVQTRSAIPEAQRLCLQAKFFAEKRTQADLERAIGLYRRAIELDERYAAAFSGLGRAQQLLALYGTGKARELLMAGRASARTALVLDPTDVMAHLSVATYAIHVDHNPVASRELLAKAVALAPNGPEVNRQVARRLMGLRQFNEALKVLAFAQSLDPLSQIIKLNIAIVLSAMRRFTDAEQLLQDILQTDPTSWLPYVQLSRLSMMQERYGDAVEYAATAFELRGKLECARLHRLAFATGGWDGYIRDALAHKLEFSLRRAEQAFFLMLSGENGRAMDMLNEIIDSCDENVWMISIDPRFDPLHSDPRYPALLKRAGFVMP